MPRVPRKVVPIFSPAQFGALLGVIDTSQGEGFRDLAIILTFYDTGLRLSELTGLKVDDVDLEDGSLKVMGKGGKERVVPFGKGVSRFLWHYITRFRPEPLGGRDSRLFLTADGRPMRRALIQTRIAKYGRRAGLSGVRCSPHTLRHSAAVNFLRNGGNVFSLQRLLGHSTLEMTRHYCELADVDVKKAHLVASPVDNMMAGASPGTVSRLRTMKRR